MNPHTKARAGKKSPSKSRPKLKPCPFCGGKAEPPEVIKIGTPTFAVYAVHCEDCSASAGLCFYDPKKAVKAWNRRPK